MNAALPHLPALQVVLPLLGSILVAFTRRASFAFAIALTVSWIMPLVAALLLAQVLVGGPISYAIGGWPPPLGIEYRVDALNALDPVFEVLRADPRVEGGLEVAVVIAEAREALAQLGRELVIHR